ncbi:MAG: MT-A70 family methyltransferase [Chloroflexi bacterium]|nr:MT-A70 family methyltransferase [Chloroflexota bacterium]
MSGLWIGSHPVFGVRGRLPATNGRLISTVIHAPRQRHSQKPENAYRIIECSSPGPRLELFARQVRTGWDAWGDEVESALHLIG